MLCSKIFMILFAKQYYFRNFGMITDKKRLMLFFVL